MARRIANMGAQVLLGAQFSEEMLATLPENVQGNLLINLDIISNLEIEYKVVRYAWNLVHMVLDVYRLISFSFCFHFYRKSNMAGCHASHFIFLQTILIEDYRDRYIWCSI